MTELLRIFRYQDPDARNKINDFSIEYFGTRSKLFIDSMKEGIKPVFTEINDFQYPEKSK